MSNHTIYRYSVSYGLSGCYLPDNSYGPIIGNKRKELTSFIRSELKMYDIPVSLIKEIRITNLWERIKKYGSSCEHFSFSHKGYTLSFHGLTEDEANQLELLNDL